MINFDTISPGVVMPSRRNLKRSCYPTKRKHRFLRDGSVISPPDLTGCLGTGELLIQGDNLEALKLLRNIPEGVGKIRLVHIDPPFGTRQIFNMASDRISTISRVNGGEIAYRDNLSGEAYLGFLKLRLEAIREIMADDGSIYVHIDYKIGHYVKCLMDEVFGPANFVNDITRIKCNPKNFSRRSYGNVKDMILFYRKTKQFVWNDVRQPIEIPMNDRRFRAVESNGRRYTTTPLHAPGETANGSTGKPWRGLRPPQGRHWRYPPSALEELDKKGLIVNGPRQETPERRFTRMKS